MDTASNSLKRLYLFDIDGTLITSGGAGEASLKQATKDFCGKEIDFSPVTIAGNTDTGIARHLLSLAGMESTDHNIMAVSYTHLPVAAIAPNRVRSGV